MLTHSFTWICDSKQGDNHRILSTTKQDADFSETAFTHETVSQMFSWVDNINIYVVSADTNIQHRCNQVQSFVTDLFRDCINVYLSIP